LEGNLRNQPENAVRRSLGKIVARYNQTWWTRIIARSLGLFARLQPGDALRISKGDLLAQMTREVAGKAASG
jgi:hypothetical protein